MQLTAQGVRDMANRAARSTNAGALGLTARRPASSALARVSKANFVVGAEIAKWNIDLRPYTRLALENALEIVPALRALDPRMLALISMSPAAQGLRGRMSAGALEDGDPTFQFPDDSGDPGGGWIDQPIQGAGASGSSEPNDEDPGAATGILGGIGDAIGDFENPDQGGPDFGDLGGVDESGGGTDESGGGTVEQVPGTQGTADPGVVLQCQVDLSVWNQNVPGACSPSDYGATPDEFTGVVDQRFTEALQSYQFWADRVKGQNLLTDGWLDPPTYISLTNTVAPWLAGEPAAEPKSSGGMIFGLTPVEAAFGAAALVGGWLLLRKKAA